MVLRLLERQTTLDRDLAILAHVMANNLVGLAHRVYSTVRLR